MRMFQREYKATDKEAWSNLLDLQETDEKKPSCFYYYGYPKTVAFSKKKPNRKGPSKFIKRFLEEEW